jgi:very-short-patch-repair endonuclease
VDFVCLSQSLIIELDGGHHADDENHDVMRDQWLQTQNFRVLRFWNNEWSSQRENVLQVIWNELHKDPLSPNPSPASGEGNQI